MKAGKGRLSPIILLFALTVVFVLLFMFQNSKLFPGQAVPSSFPSATSTKTSTFPAPGPPGPSVTPLASATPSITPAPTEAKAILQIGVHYPNPNTDAILLYQGATLDYFDVPVLIAINNIGTAGVNDPFAFSMNYRINNQLYPAKFRLDGNSPYLASTPIPSIAAGQVINFTVSVMVPRTYSGLDISLEAQADICQKDVLCNFDNQPVELPGIVYDFINSARFAWWTGYDPTNPAKPLEYILGFNRTINNRGFVLLSSRKTMEDGSQPDYVLYTHPAWVPNGAVWGYYNLDKIRFQAGDLLVARVGMIEGAEGDGVTFSLRCVKAPPKDSPGIDLIRLYHAPGGALRDLVIPLPADVVNGQCSQFYLAVEAGPTSDTDWAAWVAAYIARP